MADQTKINEDRRRQEFERLHAELSEHGYRDIPEHRGLKVGARVRHAGQRWYDAIEHGTATVLAVMQKDPSSWARSYGRPDIELLVDEDRPIVERMPIGQWADYHTALPTGRIGGTDG